MKYLSKQTIYINSRRRESGTDSNFEYKIPLQQPNEFTHVVVAQAVIPKTYFSIQDGFNTFTLRINSLTATVTTPPANYVRDALSSVLKIKLEAAALSLGFTLTFSVTHKNPFTEGDDGYYTYTVGGTGISSITTISFIFGDEDATDMFEPMGFAAPALGSTIAYAFTSGATFTLVSTAVPKLQPEDALFIHSDICTTTSRLPDDILQEVYANTGTSAFGNILFQQFDSELNAKPIAGNSGGVFRFRVTNESNEPFDFNSCNVLITLTVYQINDTSRMVRGFIKVCSAVIDLLEPFISWFAQSWEKIMGAG